MAAATMSVAGDGQTDNVAACLSGSSCILSFMPEIVEQVLKNLPVRELNRCARVCSLWRDTAIKVKNRRKYLTWFCLGEAKGKIPKKTAMHIAEDFKHFLQNIPVEPSYALMFCSTPLYESGISSPCHASGTRRHERACKQEKLQFEAYMKRLLPDSCDIIGPVTDGIAGTEAYAFKSIELENTKALSCLFLPQLPSVKLYPFVITGDTYWQLMERKIDHENLHEILCMPEEETPRVVLFFHAQQFVYSVDIVSALVKTYENITVCGGYTDHLLPSCSHTYEETENVVTGISICGDDVKMASVLIDKYVVKVEDVERRLMALKNTHIPEERSVCFMFACMGRGYYHYKQDNVESAAYRKLFPNTPLFGFFGNGEIGYDYLPDYSRDNPHKGALIINNEDDESGLHPTLYHAYTTVFCMVSLGGNSSS